MGTILWLWCWTLPTGKDYSSSNSCHSLLIPHHVFEPYEADACSKSSWASPNSLSGSCCSLHVAGLRQEMVPVEIGLKPLSLSWLLPSEALLASCWFRRQSFPYKSAVLRNKWLTRKAAARVFEKPSLSPAIHHPSKPSALHSGRVENPQSCWRCSCSGALKGSLSCLWSLNLNTVYLDGLICCSLLELGTP